MQESYVEITKGATAYVGPDAVLLMKAMVLKSSLNLYVKTKMRPTRSVGPTDMLTIATSITGKPYKRGQYELAMSHLAIWIDTMKAAMPIKEEE